MRPETANILAFLDQFTMETPDTVAQKIADDFRKRRIEKGLTRQDMAEESGVALANIARFEQKGLISLKNLLGLATALGYLGELKNLFAEQKFSTIEELDQIRRNQGKKRAYPNSKLRRDDF